MYKDGKHTGCKSGGDRFQQIWYFFLVFANIFDVGICIAKTKAASFFSASRHETAIPFLVATS
jgi:hypothetical protein